MKDLAVCDFLDGWSVSFTLTHYIFDFLFADFFFYVWDEESCLYERVDKVWCFLLCFEILCQFLTYFQDSLKVDWVKYIW